MALPSSISILQSIRITEVTTILIKNTKVILVFSCADFKSSPQFTQPPAIWLPSLSDASFTALSLIRSPWLCSQMPALPTSYSAQDALRSNTHMADFLTSFKPSLKHSTCSVNPLLNPLLTKRQLSSLWSFQTSYLAPLSPPLQQVSPNTPHSSTHLFAICLFPYPCNLHKSRDLSYFVKNPKLHENICIWHRTGTQ